MKRWMAWGIFCVSLILCVKSAGTVIAPDFSPVDIRMDLSHESDTTHLGSDWDIRPVPKWRGIVQVFDRGHPATVLIHLPSSGSWAIRFKLLFLKSETKVQLSVNGVSIGMWGPQHVGQAEKFQVLLPDNVAQVGDNTLSFAPSGPPASVIYEQVRVLNFYSKLWKRHLYLLPVSQGKDAAPSGAAVFGNSILGVTGGLLLWFLASAGMAVLGGWSVTKVFFWQSFGWFFVGVAAAIFGSLPRISPYRLVGTSLGYWAPLAWVWLVAQLPIFLVALWRRISMLVLWIARWIGVLGPEGLNTFQEGLDTFQRLGRIGIWFLIKFAKYSAAFIIGILIGILRFLGSVLLWICRNQHPFGYLKIGGIFLTIALISSWFGWKDLHDWVSHAAGICVLISITKEAIRSLREEEMDHNESSSP